MTDTMAGLIAEIDAEMKGRERGYADVRGELLFRCREALAAQPSAGARGEAVEGESVALMRPFWVSWWGEPGSFELHRPWWVSGERDDGLQSICAAVLAQDEFTARLSVQWAHDDKDAVIEWRFAEEKPKGWSPFGSRFRQADWMRWPENATPAQPDTGAVEALREALGDVRLRELRKTCELMKQAGHDATHAPTSSEKSNARRAERSLQRLLGQHMPAILAALSTANTQGGV